MVNSSWFGDLNVAKSYKTKDNHIYRWKTMNKTNLFKINSDNEKFINDIFSQTNIKLTPTISIKKSKMSKIKYDHPYLKMTLNEQSLFEFNFCFGFMSVKEQYEFMKFMKYLIENKITDIKRRDGKSILDKLKIKINYYKVTSFIK